MLLAMGLSGPTRSTRPMSASDLRGAVTGEPSHARRESPPLPHITRTRAPLTSRARTSRFGGELLSGDAQAGCDLVTSVSPASWKRHLGTSVNVQLQGEIRKTIALDDGSG